MAATHACVPRATAAHETAPKAESERTSPSDDARFDAMYPSMHADKENGAGHAKPPLRGKSPPPDEPDRKSAPQDALQLVNSSHAVAVHVVPAGNETPATAAAAAPAARTDSIDVAHGARMPPLPPIAAATVGPTTSIATNVASPAGSTGAATAAGTTTPAEAVNAEPTTASPTPSPADILAKLLTPVSSPAPAPELMPPTDAGTADASSDAAKIGKAAAQGFASFLPPVIAPSIPTAAAQAAAPLPSEDGSAAPAATPQSAQPAPMVVRPAPAQIHATAVPTGSPAADAMPPVTEPLSFNAAIATADRSPPAAVLAGTLAAAASLVHRADRDANTSSDIASPEPMPMLATAGPAQHHNSTAAADGKTAAPPVHDPQFADVLGARLSWLAERNVGRAEISLTPRGGGSLDVHVRVDGNHVRADFASTNADVRQALESHLPRLREMLADRGFTLADAQVGSQHRPPAEAPAVAQSGAPTEDVAANAASVIVHAAHDGLVDAFA